MGWKSGSAGRVEQIRAGASSAEGAASTGPERIAQMREDRSAGGNARMSRPSSEDAHEARRSQASSPFAQLDYLYTPSTDVAADAKLFIEVLGGKLAFAVEGMGARVAMIELTDGPPHVLLTDHLDGERTIYIYRVDDLGKAVGALKRRGLEREHRLEIPMGPCSSFVLPNGHRIAVYEASRPDVLQHFLGRRDF